VAVAIEHAQGCPAGQELNHARVDAVLEHERHAGMPHRVVTYIDESNGIHGSDDSSARRLLRGWLAVLALPEDISAPGVTTRQQSRPKLARQGNAMNPPRLRGRREQAEARRRAGRPMAKLEARRR